MNCAEVETTLLGLARGEGISPLEEKRAMSHVRSCQACDHRLASEQRLTGRLEALRVDMQAEAAPARVEAALLGELSRQNQRPVEFAAARRTPRPATVRLLAAAAALLLAIAVLALVLVSRPGSDSPHNAESRDPLPQQDPAVNPVPKDVTPGRKEDEVASPSTDRKANVGSKRPRRFHDPIGRRQKPARPGSGEIATEFLPVAGFPDPSDVEEGQVLRVELPRSALLSFGLPMNPDRAGERVRADVLVGSDGLARAIRFVGGNSYDGR